MTTNNQLNSNFHQIAVADSNGNITGITLTGPSDLGDVANLAIAGGNVNEVLTTDGTGNLSWVLHDVANTIANGTSNVSIPVADGNVNTSAGGVANVLVVTTLGANITGDLAVTGNITGNIANANFANFAAEANFANFAGNVTVNAQPNITSVGNLTSLTVEGVSTLGAVGNVKITGGTNAQYLQTDGTGNLAWGTISSDGIANGTSNVTIPVANGNINMSVGGFANLVVVSSGNTTHVRSFVVPPYEGTITARIDPDLGFRVIDSNNPTQPTMISASVGSTISGNLAVTRNIAIKTYTETTTTSVNTGAVLAPDASLGTIRHYTADQDFTFNGFTNPIAGQSMTVIITQPGGGAKYMTSTMKFVGGNKTLSESAGAMDMICILYSGSNYFASLTKDYK